MSHMQAFHSHRTINVIYIMFDVILTVHRR